jgi:poly(3-hydroxybutyrate) depolymerase
MLYQLYQAQTDLLAPFRRGAATWLDVWGRDAAETGNPGVRLAAAAADLFSTAVVTHKRPAFGIDSVVVDNNRVPVREVPVFSTPFGTLLRFEKDMLKPQPKVLLVAPMSGHFATLLRATVQTMLPDCDVHITDWHNARDVPLSAGPFGFEDYTDHLIRFLEFLHGTQDGAHTHMVAVCQPAVGALVATAVMSAAKNPATPHTLTLMAGPIDTRLSRLPAAHQLHGHERGPAHQRASGPIAPPVRRRGRSRRRPPTFLRRVFRGAGPAGRILPGNGGARIQNL